MSGLEALGIVASVLQIADVGARLSVKLYTFSHKVKSADTNVQNISSDVAVTCTVLRELGETLKKDEEAKLSNHNAIATAERVIGECRKIFSDLEVALDGSQCDVGSEKGKGKGVLKRIGRGVKFSIAEPQIELLRCNLERLKSTLLLMLNVIIYAGHLRNKEAPSIVHEQRELIRALHEAKQQNEKKAEDLAKAIEGIGSLRDEASRGASLNSTVRSISTASFVQQPNEQLDDSRNKGTSTDALPQMDSGIPLLEAQLPDLGELGNYCAVVKILLQNIEMVKDRIRVEYSGSFREGIIDSHTKNTQSLIKQHGHEKVSKAFHQFFVDTMSPGDHSASTACNDALIAFKLAQIGLLPVPEFSISKSHSMRAITQEEDTIPSTKSGQDPSTPHLQPPRPLGPQLTLQPPDAHQPQAFFEPHSPPPRSDLRDQSNRGMNNGETLFPPSPAGSSGGRSPTISFSEPEASEYHLYSAASPESPRSDGRQSLSLKRDRDPPKNSEGQLYCNHEDCRRNPPAYRRLSEWNKHMDKHERPYKCAEPGCASLQGFTYSGGLLRHQREVHKKNVATKINFMCPHAGCNRGIGQGFTRQENLKEHLRRRHPTSAEEAAAQADDGAEDLAGSGRESKRRRTDSDVKGERDIHEKAVRKLTERLSNLERRAPALKSSDEAEEKELESVDDLLLYWTNVPRTALE